MKTLLLVTWVILNSLSEGAQVQSHSYQVVFSSEKTCEAARSALLDEGLRIVKATRTAMVHISALCVAQ
jgi:hypothetical protein